MDFFAFFVDKVTAPWDVSIKDVRISTLSEKSSHRPLLKRFSADCSVGVSFRNNDADDHIATLCVHFHFQPLFVDLTKRQVIFKFKCKFSRLV